MALSLMLEVRPFGFVPVTNWDAEQKARFPIGCTVRASISKGKSRLAERFYWAVIDKVGKATGIGKYPLSHELLVRTGFVDTLKFRNGAIHATPRSIADMKHDEFMEYMDAALDLICAEYVALSRGKLVAEIEKMLKITYEQATRSPKKGKDDGEG